MRDLNTKQKQAAMWIGYGLNQTEAANKVGVSDQAVSDWKHNQNGIGEAFAAEIRKWADRFCGEISGEALAALRQALKNPMDRVSAGKAILDRQAKIERREIELDRLDMDRKKAEMELNEAAK